MEMESDPAYVGTRNPDIGTPDSDLQPKKKRKISYPSGSQMWIFCGKDGYQHE